MLESFSDVSGSMWEQVRQDNQHFKSLLDLIPPQTYFNQEEKDEIWGNVSGDEDDVDMPRKKRKRKGKGQGSSLSAYSVTQITEMRQRGETLGTVTAQKRAVDNRTNGTDTTQSGIELKHEEKKRSRSAKGNKHKGKELEKREARLEELRERLRQKLQNMKGYSKAAPTQEEKRLRRRQSKLNAKLKSKSRSGEGNRVHKSQQAASDGLKSPPQTKIVNESGQPVKSKFDFSVITFDTTDGRSATSHHKQAGKEKSGTSDLHGRDYKRLLDKVERRKEKVEQLKEKDPSAGQRLEEKFQWAAMMSKARGEKVKDDPAMLKKAAKRKEKLKERKGKKWEERKKVTEGVQQKRQEKRQANIAKRKDATKEKKRKKMIKKGRIIPGF